MEKDTNPTSASAVAKTESFDGIPLAEKTTAINCRTRRHSGDVKESAFRRHLPGDKSTVYLVSSPQETCFVGDMVKEDLPENNTNQNCLTRQCPPSPPKRRRYGVTEVTTESEQRQRKIGIAENKQSTSDRTFLRVLHKKF